MQTPGSGDRVTLVGGESNEKKTAELHLKDPPEVHLKDPPEAD